MTRFFGIPIDAQSTAGMTLALLLSVALGGIIGLERQIRGRDAGLRTHILVCVGSTLMTLVSVNIGTAAGGDPGRIAAQIVSGIGFLGAGAIIRDGPGVKGLTTAASVWTTAGIGLALGAGPRFAQLAVITTVIVVFTLWILDKVEDWLDTKLVKLELLEIQLQKSDAVAARVLARVAEQDIFIRRIDYDEAGDTDKRTMMLRIRLPRRLGRQAFLAALQEDEGVISVRMD